jgi:hypothetical protein
MQLTLNHLHGGTTLRKLVMLAGLLCCLTATAHAQEDDLEWNVVVSQEGKGGLFGLFYLVQLALFAPEVDTRTALSFGPTDAGVSIDLGRPEAPWQTIHANGYTANGAPGLDTVIRIGQCQLTIQGGLIVATTRCHENGR